MKTFILSNMKRLGICAIFTFSILSLSACGSAEDKANSYFENGMKLLEQEELAKANVEFRNALQIDRKMTKALWGQLLVAEKQGKTIRSYKLLNAVLNNEPEHLQALIKIGRILLIAGQYDKALEKSDVAMRVNNKDSEVLSLRASILLKLNDNEGAVKLASQVIDNDPAFVDALVVLASERLAADDAVKALEFLNQGLKTSDKNIALRLIKIKALEKLARTDEAEKVLKELIAYYPEVSDFHYVLAQFYLQQKRNDEAEKQFRAVVEVKPESVQAKLKLVQLLSALKGTDVGREQLLTFSRNEPKNYDLKFALVAFYIAIKNADLANNLLTSIETSATDNDIILRAKGIKAGLLIGENDKKSAEKVVNEILALDKDNANGLVLKASIDIDRQQYETAINDLRVVLRGEPNSSRAMFFLAKAHHLSGSIELADQQYFKAFKASKYNASYGVAYAQFLLKRKLVSRAEKILLNVLDANKNNLSAMNLLAKTRLALGDWVGAQEVADNIKRIGDKEKTADQIFNAILVGKKDYSQSIELLKKSYASAPSNVQPVVSLVRTYLLAGKAAEAGRFLDAIINTNPDDFNARILRAQVYSAQGKNTQAIATYEKAIQQNPNNAASYYNLGIVYLRTKQVVKAAKAVDKGLSVSPDSFALLLTRAGLYEQQNQPDEAIKIYEKLLIDKPDADIVVNNLASLLTDYRTDEESFNRAYTLAQRFKRSQLPQFKDTIGWASYRVGKYADAATLLETAIKELPGIPVFHYHLGMNHLARKDKVAAKVELEKALQLAGDNSFAQASEISEILKGL